MFKNKNAQAMVIGIAIVVLAIGAVIVFGDLSENDSDSTGENSENGQNRPSGGDNAQQEQNNDGSTETESSGENVVEMSSGGFTPETLTIDQGDTVVFENVGSSGVWPAVDLHPTHTQYDGTSTSEHCSSGEPVSEDTFDACRGVQPGETYSFTFDKTGEWNYHDHLKASNTGTIIVE